MNAVIYCRVSTKEQTQNLSLPTQEKACREYCQQHGYSVDRVFVEEGESAKSANRTEFQKLISYCAGKKTNVQAVVVYNLSRFSRNVADHAAVQVLLRKNGIKLRSVTEPIDESPTGKLMEGVFSAFAQFDNDVRSERTKVGMKAAIAAGRWPFKAPLGYLNSVGSRTGPSLILDPERAPFVIKAFELYATGQHTKQQVLKTATDLGLTTAKGQKVSMQTFQQMLTKPVYAGWISVKEWNENQLGDFQPLISQEVFDKVQAVLRGRRMAITPYQRSHPDFPLRRFTACGGCGKPLTGSWSKGRTTRYPYYHCPNESCQSVRLRKEKLEEDFFKYLGMLRPEAGYLKLFKAIVLDAWKGKCEDAFAIHGALEQKIARLKERKQRVLDAFLHDRVIDKATYQEQASRLDEEITSAQLDLNETDREELNVEAALEFAEEVLSNPGKLWKELPTPQKQRLQKVLFPKGVQYSAAGFGTDVTCSIFSLLRPKYDDESSMATLTGFEPVFAA
jgi:site-specific DNA recombinase